MDILSEIPLDWREAIAPFYTKEQADVLGYALQARFDAGENIYPARENIFRALKETPFSETKAVWLGQDPYHEPGQAIGLAFAVPNGTKMPPSLKNIFKEYISDLEKVFMPTDSTLLDWAHNGVLLLNTCLTVRAHAAGSHRKLGWEPLVQAILKAAAQRPRSTAFILLGNDARAYRELVDDGKNVIFEAAHPSPLSAFHGFFGSRPFTTVNDALVSKGEIPVQW
ncbi:MAG: uracil-DNA glycosylase [Victivallales bacterium]|nr:uracil-DNA glycosylase [Victivallales bacterium]